MTQLSEREAYSAGESTTETTEDGERLWRHLKRERRDWRTESTRRTAQLSDDRQAVLECQRVRECQRRASLQGEERKPLLERGRLRLCERHASLLGEEREAVLESQRVCEYERHASLQGEERETLLERERLRVRGECCYWGRKGR